MCDFVCITDPPYSARPNSSASADVSFNNTAIQSALDAASGTSPFVVVVPDAEFYVSVAPHIRKDFVTVLLYGTIHNNNTLNAYSSCALVMGTYNWAAMLPAAGQTLYDCGAAGAAPAGATTVTLDLGTRAAALTALGPTPTTAYICSKSYVANGSL